MSDHDYLVWYKIDDENTPEPTSYVKTETEFDLLCPKCLRAAEYRVEEVDEEEDGCRVWGWFYVCWNCGICTDTQEL